MKSYRRKLSETQFDLTWEIIVNFQGRDISTTASSDREWVARTISGLIRHQSPPRYGHALISARIACSHDLEFNKMHGQKSLQPCTCLVWDHSSNCKKTSSTDWRACLRYNIYALDSFDWLSMNTIFILR